MREQEKNGYVTFRQLIFLFVTLFGVQTGFLAWIWNDHLSRPHAQSVDRETLKLVTENFVVLLNTKSDETRTRLERLERKVDTVVEGIRQ